MSLIFSDKKLLAENQDKLFNLCEPRANLLQLCLILCDPMDRSPPGSSVHGILQARTLEWITMPSSRASSQPRDITSPALAGGFFTTSISSQIWEFPGSLVVRTLNFRCRELGFYPSSGELKFLHASWRGQQNQKKTQKMYMPSNLQLRFYS